VMLMLSEGQHRALRRFKDARVLVNIMSSDWSVHFIGSDGKHAWTRVPNFGLALLALL
jgi:hypothetical protein